MAPLLSMALVALLLRGGASNCAQDGSDYSYTETLSSSTRTIVTNHCPNHPYYNLNPNTAIANVNSYELPTYPIFEGTATSSSTSSANVDLSEEGGIVGLLFSGSMLYSPYGGLVYGQVTGWTSSATYAEGNTFDQCGCHSSSSTSASYHCHVPPSCLLRQLGQEESSHSPQIGWAFDGFPLYGPRGPRGVMMQTCTETGGTYGTDVCTDDCGGYYSSDGSIDEFVYRYYMQGEYNDGRSCDLPGCASPSKAYYPNSPVCFRGCCPSGVSCHRLIPRCPSSGTLDGYTSSYSPSVPEVSGLSLASGLPQNSGGCSCGQLACATCSSSDQDWSSSSCGTSNRDNWGNNTCPSSSTSGASTAEHAAAAPGARAAAIAAAPSMLAVEEAQAEMMTTTTSTTAASETKWITSSTAGSSGSSSTTTHGMMRASASWVEGKTSEVTATTAAHDKQVVASARQQSTLVVGQMLVISALLSLASSR